MSEKNTMKNHCKSVAELQNYLRNKAQNHNSYKYYSKIEFVRPIVRELALYLKTGGEWNDTADREVFNNDSDTIRFGKCFSFSQDENVAMWMLYGGIYHTGAMIDFTKFGMNNILKAPKIELGYFENTRFCSVADVDRTDFNIWITDIVYCNEGKRYLRRSDESCVDVSVNIINALGYCKKAYPWHYENECRLIVSVSRSVLPQNYDTVKIDLSAIQLGKTMERVYYCPGYRGEKTEGFRDSKLNKSVEWELRDEKCRNCKKV